MGMVPLILNITMAVAFLASFLCQTRLMLALWGYCFIVYKVIEYAYPEYWQYIHSLSQ